MANVYSSRSASRSPANWLLWIACMVLFTVIVGGLTRLTGSGLSITEWKPITGAIPPLNAADWDREFALYKAVPQFSQVNPHMNLSEFKFIYAWEWGHRQIGRLIGLVFFFPMIYFFYKKAIPKSYVKPVITLFFLGGLQGLIGWIMVKSGLTERVTVSQYRLAVHLTLAAVIYAGLVWVALGLRSGKDFHFKIPLVLKIALFCVLLQIMSGAFTAGSHAGHIYNTFPLIDGAIIPDHLFPNGAISAFEDLLTVQFIHRVGALAVTIAVLFAIYDLFYRKNRSFEAFLLTGALILQILLGIFTLITVAPVEHIELASAHQIGAFLLLTVCVFSAARIGNT